ncbi:uncharacterized protein FFB14_15850 [Fusarium fujikuroi]|nr:uncharacterized protein FFB14_15850 [Fusarium fujikuroi]
MTPGILLGRVKEEG